MDNDPTENPPQLPPESEPQAEIDADVQPEPEAEALAERDVNAYDRTPAGYMELLEELRFTQSALYSEYRLEMAANPYTIDSLRAAARGHVDRINKGRAAQVDIETVDPNFLVGLVQPNWSEHIPPANATEEQENEWDRFKQSFTQMIQMNLDGMREMHNKVAELNDDEDFQSRFAEYRSERLGVLRAVATFRVARRKKAALSKEMANIRMRAAQAGRPRLTRAEERGIAMMRAEMQGLDDSWRSLIDSEEKRDQVKIEIKRANRLDDKRQKEKGVLVDRQMERIISDSLPALYRGEPMLLLGETGGGKTALAKYIPKEYFGQEPVLIKCHAQMSAYELLGKTELRQENGASVSEYRLGLLTQAMEEGRPVILDEFNALQEITKVLNEIAQARPGNKFVVQEGREIIVKEGFFIICTMNEKSKRYKHVDDVSAELMNRFGANVYRVQYPDHDKSYSDLPKENARLIYAEVCDDKGELPPHISRDEIDNFVKAGFKSQQIFNGTHGEGNREAEQMIPNDRLASNLPGLETSVLAPRTMTDIARKVAKSYGEVTFDSALRNFVDGIHDETDKLVFRRLLMAHGFLRDSQEV